MPDHIVSYVHHDANVGVLVQLRVDYVTSTHTERLKAFGLELTQHIARSDPTSISGIDPDKVTQPSSCSSQCEEKNNGAGR